MDVYGQTGHLNSFGSAGGGAGLEQGMKSFLCVRVCVRVCSCVLFVCFVCLFSIGVTQKCVSYWIAI